MLTEREIDLCMEWSDHTCGDKDGADVVLSDRIVVARKDHPFCMLCGKGIKKGEHCRVTTVIWDGFQSGRHCERCCKAMASDIENEDCDAVEEIIWRRNGWDVELLNGKEEADAVPNKR